MSQFIISYPLARKKSLFLSFTDLRPETVFCSHGDLQIGHDLLSSDEFELASLHQYGQHDLRFEQGKVLPDAVARSSCKRKIGKWVG